MQRSPDGGPGSARPSLDELPGFEAARAVADAVLYEGYLLYPYRRSAAKNQVRWQFGVLVPRDVLDEAAPQRPTVAGSADSWRQQTQMLLEAPGDAFLHVRLRFLQLQHRAVERTDADGGWQPVDRLEVDGRLHVAFDEALAREADLSAAVADLTGPGRSTTVQIPGGTDVELLHDVHGRPAGRLVRRSLPVMAVLRLRLDPAAAPFPLWRVVVDVENAVRDVAPGLPRADVLGCR